MTTCFDPSALPVPRLFYERELGELRRPSRGWAQPKAGCPFHPSESKTSFSIHLDSGGFYCHGCGAKGGDVLDFLKLRYHADFRTAAGMVGALREATPAARQQMEQHQRDQEQAEVRRVAAKQAERHERIELRDEMLDCTSLVNELSAALDTDRENDALWGSLVAIWELREKYDAEYCRRFL